MDEQRILHHLRNDFDWVVRSSRVWNDPLIDVDTIHPDAREELILAIDELQQSKDFECPLGLVFVGVGGSGKTHLLQWLRQQAYEKGMNFLFADMTGVRDFWETMQSQAIAAIDHELPDGYRQCQHVLAGLLNTVVQRPQKEPIVLADKMAKWSVAKTVDYTRKLVASLSRRHRVDMAEHRDVLRALIMLNSEDPEVNNAAHAWLHGTESDDELLRQFAFTSSQQTSVEIVRGVSWLLSLRGPTVLAIDQLDNLVAQRLYRFQNSEHREEEIGEDDDEARHLKAITQNIAGGMADLVTAVLRRTQVVVSCYPDTWEHVVRETLLSAGDRFRKEVPLSLIRAGESSRQLIEGRLAAAEMRLGMKFPPSPWLFDPGAFETAVGLSPREVLKRCEDHRQHCLKQGRVQPLMTFDSTQPSTAPDNSGLADTHYAAFDAEFTRLKHNAEISSCMDKDHQDGVWPDLLTWALRGLALEFTVPTKTDLVVDENPTGGKSYLYLHARFAIVNHQRQGLEQHFCFRAIGHTQAVAFQNRLKAAITDTGIDKRLGFRSLTILRNEPAPTGPKTQQLVAKFDQMGGHWSGVSEGELRTLFALRTMLQTHGSEAHDWVRMQRPVSKLRFVQASGVLEAIVAAGGTHVEGAEEMRKAASGVASSTPKPAAPAAPPITSPPVAVTAVVTPSRSASPGSNGHLCFGARELASGKLGEPVVVPWVGLTRHTMVVAGAGSGKTNLLKRMIEDAAVAGIPSIVLDCNNDLVGLGERRLADAHPPEWTDFDRAKEQYYTDAREVITWTPNRQDGNPLALRLLPDFKDLVDDPHELAAAIDAACNDIAKVVAPGNSAKSRKMQGVLAEVVKYFAHHGGGPIELLIEMLRELPADVEAGINQQDKLAGEMADLLQAKLNSTPLWKAEGTPLDPGTLFGLDWQKTRISILSMIGLPEQEMQQMFLYQLAIPLLAWIKRNPAPEGTLRGLLVIDEAKEFVPSGQASACKEALVRLTAQARKFGLGLVFATQAPKDIDHRILNNCFMQMFGHVNPPTAVQAARDLLTQKQASDPASVARLNKGQFFFHNGEVDERAFRIRTSQCLSHHTSPMLEEEVLARAVASRELLGE